MQLCVTCSIYTATVLTSSPPAAQPKPPFYMQKSRGPFNAPALFSPAVHLRGLIFMARVFKLLPFPVYHKVGLPLQTANFRPEKARPVVGSRPIRCIPNLTDRHWIELQLNSCPWSAVTTKLPICSVVIKIFECAACYDERFGRYARTHAHTHPLYDRLP